MRESLHLKQVNNVYTGNQTENSGHQHFTHSFSKDEDITISDIDNRGYYGVASPVPA